MKFWQKIYLSILLLFLVVFNLLILSFARSIYQQNLNSTRALVNNQFYSFQSILRNDMKTLQSKRVLSDELLFALCNSYSNNNKKNSNTFFALNSKESTIFNNFPTSVEKISSHFEHAKESALLYRDDDVSYYIIRSALTEPFSEYTLLYSFRLIDLENYFDELGAKCLITSLFVSLGLSFLLFLFAKNITKPLFLLADASQVVALGNYAQKLEVKGNDEFAEVSRHFNVMAAEIERKILLLQEEIFKKQLLIDNLTHELNTPLTSIQGYSQYLMVAECSEAERYEALEYIQKEAQRLSLLSEQLGLLLESRSIQLDCQTVNLSELLASILQTLRFQLDKKQITLDIQNFDLQCYCDSSLFTSLLRNLVENAARACSQNGIITIKGFETKDSLYISISDNGCGLSEEQLLHITEPFYRVDKSRSRASGGYGLGLALSKQIVERHLGTISFDSKLGQGTTVTLLFTTCLQVP